MYIIYTEYSATDYSAYKLTSYETLTDSAMDSAAAARQSAVSAGLPSCSKSQNGKTQNGQNGQLAIIFIIMKLSPAGDPLRGSAGTVLGRWDALKMVRARFLSSSSAPVFVNDLLDSALFNRTRT